jgi:hypothetical protein
MPFTQWLIYRIPALWLGLIIVSLFVAISISGLLLVRKFIPHHKLKVHNDVAGAIFSTLGVAYTVLLAFVVVIVWQNFDKARVNVEMEANCLVDIYRDSIAFSRSFQGKTQALLKDYTDVVVNEEWEMLARGGQSPKTRELLSDIWFEYSSYEPITENEKIFLAESVRKLNNMGELRRLRLLDARTGVHPILWLILIIGGTTTIMFTFFFGSENLRAQITMASMLALVIALILYTMLLLDFPFTGALSIPSDAFETIPRL